VHTAMLGQTAEAGHTYQTHKPTTFLARTRAGVPVKRLNQR